MPCEGGGIEYVHNYPVMRAKTSLLSELCSISEARFQLGNVKLGMNVWSQAMTRSRSRVRYCAQLGKR